MLKIGNQRFAGRLAVAVLPLLLAACGGGGGGGAPVGGGPPPPPQCTGGPVDNTPLAAPNPLLSEMWHLVNTGQTAFSSPFSAPGDRTGHDINHTAAATGLDITVAVVDTGLEIGHEDLENNVIADDLGGRISHNFLNASSDPTPTNCGGDHGTSVAGLAASQAGNGLGGQGVAPAANLVGYNFLQSQGVPNQMDSLGGATFSSGVDVFNQSYGTGNTDDFLIDATFEAHLKNQVTTGRNNLGQLFVKSAGNGFIGFGFPALADCRFANPAGLSCQNANMDPNNAVPWNIVVGSVNAEGRRASYSTAGSALLVSAPGGEFGYDSNFKPGYVAVAYEPAMITTDRSGCGRGYSHTNFDLPGTIIPGNPPHNDLQDDHPLDLECNYTSTFNGTSSAAPVVSGVIAQILSAKSGLTWRDVRHILITTADSASLVSTGSPTPLNLSPNGIYTAELGWTPNNSGLGIQFHNWFGFGRVDATAAVAAAVATTTPTLWGVLVSTDPFTGLGVPINLNSSNPNLAIPDANPLGATDTITLNATGIAFVEAVQIKVWATHTWSGDLAIELRHLPPQGTNPTGTKSILFTTENGFGGSDNLAGMVLLSNAFYGEAADGDWEIHVVDGHGGDTGTLDRWEIRVHGH